MKPLYYTLLFLIATCCTPCLAHNIQISNMTMGTTQVNGVTHQTITADVSAAGQFRMSYLFYTAFRFHAKYKNVNGSNWQTLWFTQMNHTVTCNAGCGCAQLAPANGGAQKNFTNETGYMSLVAWQGACGWPDSISVSVTMVISNQVDLNYPEIRLFADEMVVQFSDEFPGYYIGDGTSLNRWHKGNDTIMPYYFDRANSAARTVGTGANDIGTLLASGIPVTTIPAAAMQPLQYVMRYEITQKQYVDFLNCLSRAAQDTRTRTDLSGTTITNVFVMSNQTYSFAKNGIRCDANIGSGPITFYCDLNENGIANEADDGLNTPLNYISVNDLLAYLDWAGLKPMNEFQYEFHCRGSEYPVPNEYAWGSSVWTPSTLSSTSPLYGTANEDLAVVDGPVSHNYTPVKASAAASATTNRIQAGATATGMFEMTGNASEIVHGFKVAADFTAYPLAVGDGSLDILGNQNNGWPVDNGFSDVSYYVKGAYTNVQGDVPTTVSQRGGFWNTQNPLWVANPTLRAPGYGGRGGF